jgi:hypothetical protein
MSIAPSTQGGKKKKEIWNISFFFYPLVWPLKGKKKEIAYISFFLSPKDRKKTFLI